MANNYVKISELPAMQTIAGSDILPIVDTSETETKKVTKQMLLTNIDASEVQIGQLTEASQINDEDYLIITQNGTNKKISKANAKFASGDEVYVGDTEPTGEDDDSVKIWIEPSEDSVDAEGTYISNSYGVSTEIGYSEAYLNNSIVETGSNAYGNWIKYGNGTMICSRSLTGTININEAWGSGYVGYNTDEYNFSQTFIEPPIVQRTIYATGGSSFISLEWDPVQITTTYIKNIGFYRASGSANNVPFRYDFIAIGKWK